MNQLHSCKEAFRQLTNSNSWEEVQQRFPPESTDEFLKSWVGLFVKNSEKAEKSSIPRAFEVKILDLLLREKNFKHNIMSIEFNKFTNSSNLELSYYVYELDLITEPEKIFSVLGNINYQLLIGDIPYGINQANSKWDTNDWAKPTFVAEGIRKVKI
jgi:hypothetical protein